MHVRLIICAVVAGSVLAACGQRGALYIPGKPGDPYFDKQNRGSMPGQTNPPNSTKPTPQPKREDDSPT